MWIADAEKYALVGLEVKLEGAPPPKRIAPDLWVLTTTTFDVPSDLPSGERPERKSPAWSCGAFGRETKIRRWINALFGRPLGVVIRAACGPVSAPCGEKVMIPSAPSVALVSSPICWPPTAPMERASFSPG